ncbi:NAD(P)/FAD-dependent oxidoreductase [Brevundimonas sp. Root1279]|uniref:NAD(P)/FAD-dependent oxidoreductase n=1 Tax=Brevundimonas sp. Root1279 TaxID=1736443 RepID=UPI0006FF872B|nr:NAD(P)/FAD-dependent oxidoreductase [Brevundimonas sp. Root1279]KQW82497.1 pyridine nucleotide-disulfide oxidoreductase [Brevundimonas sp. Root1279]
MARRTVVIVGAGFGGLAAAKALKHANVDVVLIDRTNHHLFQPLLYQVATAALSPADIATASRTLLRGQANATVLMGEVVAVDAAAKVVRCADGKAIAYDWLILATGAAYSFFGHPEWAQEAQVLKTLDDALDIRARLLGAFERAELSGDPAEARKLTTFVVVGAGPTGVETAGTIAEMARMTLRRDFRRIDPTQARVILFEAGPRVLGAFTEPLSAYAKKALEELGVDVRTDTMVEQISDGVVQAGGEIIEAGAVLWSAGVAARPAAAWLGAEAARNGAVVVGPDCAVAGVENVFAIGDVASYAMNGAPLPGLAPVAKQQGDWVGRLIRARLEGRPDPVPFRYKDWGTMAVIGRSRAVAMLGGLRMTGLLAWLAWSMVHLMLLIDFRSRLIVYVNWTWAWFTKGRGARLLTRLP